jgi:hypothetical protein
MFYEGVKKRNSASKKMRYFVKTVIQNYRLFLGNFLHGLDGIYDLGLEGVKLRLLKKNTLFGNVKGGHRKRRNSF